MRFLLSLAGILGIEANEIIASSKRTALLWGSIALLCLVALAFLLVAAYIGLSAWIGPLWASLFIAGVAIVLAAIIYALARVSADITHRRHVDRRRSAETTALMTTAAATALPLLIKSPLVRTVGIPVGAALAALYFAYRGNDDQAREK